jgi:hypothetical protein
VSKDGSTFSEWPLYPRFIAALFVGGTVALRLSQPVGDVSKWNKKALTTVIEEARRQLDAQSVTLDRVLLRAQILLTTLLALGGVFATSAPSLWTPLPDPVGTFLRHFVFCASGALLLLGLLGATALVAVTKRYEAINAAVLSNWKKFDLARLAREYAECVGTGEQTGNAHLTVFGTAVRLTVYGSLLLGLAWAIQ